MTGYNDKDEDGEAMTAASVHGSSRREFLRYSAVVAAAAAVCPGSLWGSGADTGTTTVRTPDGAVAGDLVEGMGVFRGIPFAEAPVGPLRFRPPVAVEAWTGVREARAFGPAAMQGARNGLRTSEDCLYLNVWAPAGKGPFPVLVWIHGGGYVGGAAAGADGAAFAREGVVCVTVAYRLGAFGFMDVAPLLGPGFAGSANNAMRDLVCSLGWVRRNIGAFGGDPGRVTIGGQSAGAKAVATLMAIPQASGLFHSVISESGGGERANTAAQNAEVTSSFGEVWRGDASGGGRTFAELLTAPAAALLEAQQRFLRAAAHPFPFRPQIDGAGGTAFLPGVPVAVVAGGSAKGKRLLIGTNLDESASFIGPHPAQDPVAKDLNNVDLARFDAVFEGYKRLYPEMAAAERRVRAVSAEEYWVHSVRLADAHTRAGGEAWMYRMDYVLPDGPMKGEAVHGVEMPFVWNNLTPGEAADPAAVGLERSVHGAWVAFLREQRPAARDLPTWPRYRVDTRPTMILGPEVRVEQRPMESELRLWDGIF